MDWIDWIQDWRSIVLICFSCLITTIAMLLLIFYIIKLKISKVKCDHCYTDEVITEEEHLNSTFDNIEYSGTTTRPLFRTRSVPMGSHKRKRLSEYDSVTCKSRRPLEIDQPIIHQFDETRVIPRQDNPFQVILKDVSDALSTAHRIENNDIYETFMKEMLKNIKSKDPDLYDTIKSDVSKHMYEQIDEVKKPTVNWKSDAESEDESIYGIYVPSLGAKLGNKVDSNEDSVRENFRQPRDYSERLQNGERTGDNSFVEVGRSRANEELPGVSNYEDSFGRRDSASTSVNVLRVPTLDVYQDASTTPTYLTVSTDANIVRSETIDNVRNSQNPPDLPPKLPPKFSRRQLSRSDEDIF